MDTHINVVCYWWGDWAGYWGPIYVQKLYQALKRNTSVNFTFFCFTDEPDALRVPSIKFSPKYKWNLNKFVCFDPQYGLEGRVLTVDLDLLILDNINDILCFKEEMITCEAAYKPNLPGGSLVGTTVDFGRENLFNPVKKNTQEVEQKTGGSERFFFRQYLANYDFWQRNYPGIYSYKVDCQDRVPDDARIIRFHGKPRPHECLTSQLIEEHWR